MLLLEVSTLKRSVLHLNESTPQLHELHLDVPGEQKSVLLLGMSSSQELELNLEVYTTQRPGLHMDLSTPLGRELHMNASDAQKSMAL